MMDFSVRRELHKDSTVLLTGATGYIGSLVLEQLLRCTEAKVHVLIRGKRGLHAAQRLQALFEGPLFAQAAKAGRLHRVVAIEGDIQAPGLGLTAETTAMLQRDVHFFIHAAADVALERPIQASLRCNYCSTASVLELASSMQCLRAFVFVSTAFVNINRPKGSTVLEQLYDLPASVETGMHDTVVDAKVALLGGPACKASNKQEHPTKRSWVVGTQPHSSPRQHHEHMHTALLPHSTAAQHGIISGINTAEELLSMTAKEAQAEGRRLLARWGFSNTYTLTKHLAEKLVSRQYVEHGLPAVIVRPSIVTSTAATPYVGYLGNWAGLSVWVLAHLVGLFSCFSASAWAVTSIVDLIPGDYCACSILAAAAACSAGTAEAINPCARQQPLIVHSGTSGCNPLPTAKVWDSVVAFNDTHKAPFCLRWGRLAMTAQYPGYKPTPWFLALVGFFTQLKLALVCLLLHVLGQGPLARRLKMIHEGFRAVNNTKLDKDLTFSTSNLAQLQQAMEPSERATMPLLFDGTHMGWATYLPTFFSAVYLKAGFAKRDAQ